MKDKNSKMIQLNDKTMEEESLILNEETGYKIGDFKIILSENGELKVIVETNKHHLQIKR